MLNFDQLISIKRPNPPTAVVALANEPQCLRCVGRALSMGLARFILIGSRSKIEAVAEQESVDLKGVEFIAETEHEAACQAATELVRNGDAHILMKGLVHTATFSRAFLGRESGLIDEDRLASHIALFEVPNRYHKPFVVTDAALNIRPSWAQKACILQNAIDFSHRLGTARPKAACVAAVERVNPKMQSTLDAQALCELARSGHFSEAVIDGPLSTDLSLSFEAARTKGIDSPVAGDADILLFSDMESANVFYKALTLFTECRVASVIGGARVPIVLTSRAESERNRFLSLALAASLVEMPDESGMLTTTETQRTRSDMS